ncbi:MAG: hypothetical protein EOO26_13800 [Comamonadaceae bacterium]|nr:MAG: hypothetical protein EOO26_13800 [Comamonadaceae bacterium]
MAAVALPACALTPISPARWLQVEVQDRDSGATLPVYRADGQLYVAGRPGARYGVTIRNLRNERVLVVMSVDGVNVLTGQTAGWTQDGYVLGPYESGQIAGWRKSDREIAAFEFTAQSESYAARTGRPLDVGVIGVAVFRERRPEPRPAPPISRSRDRSDDRRSDIAESKAPASPVSPAPSQAPGESEALGRAAPSSMAADAAKSSSSSIARREAPAAEKKLGTGHGQRETSVIGRTTFERASSSPDEVLAVRYDSRANLVAQGIIPRPDSVPQRPRPFPQTPQAGFVPDPPARY